MSSKVITVKLPELTSNPRLKLFSWFKDAPSGLAFHPDDALAQAGEFSVDSCLKCGTRSKVILKADGYYLTCIRCGWIEPRENLNEVEFGPEITAEISKPDDSYGDKSNGFIIGRGHECGLSGYQKRNSEPCPPCPKCKARVVKRNGLFNTINGPAQKFRCLNCLKTFSDVSEGRIVRFGRIEIVSDSRLSIARQELAIKLLSSGNSARQTARDLGVHFATTMRIAKLVRAKYSLNCSCGKPLGSNHICAHILLRAPKRLDYLRKVSPRWRQLAA